MSTTYLNHLSEDVLALLLDYTGILWLHELLKIGNRLLSSKILKSREITSYSNLNYYGKSCSWSESIITKLQGLRSLSIKNPLPTALCDDPSPSLLLNLPKSVTEIYLETFNSLRLCTTGSKVDSALVPFDFSIYPNLNSLALKCPHETLTEAAKEENSIYIEKWVPGEILVPPSLTKFELIWPLKNIMSHIMRLPKTIRELIFLHDHQMTGISWIHQFPELEKLSISSMEILELSSQEMDLKAVKKHPSLKAISLEQLYLVDPPPQPIGALFAHFVDVEILSIPRLYFNHVDLSVLKNLRSLICASSDEPQGLDRDWYSSRLVELHCTDPLISSMVAKLQHLPSLSILSVKGKLSLEDMQLLPKSLTRLILLRGPEVTVSEIGEIFPRLVHLHIQPASFQPSELASMGSPLLVCQVDDETYVRVQDASLSLDGECGWTSLLHAATEWDFESMEKILQVQVIDQRVWLKRLIADHAWYQTVTLEVFEWLRMQGILSEPRCAGSLFYSPLFEIALDLKETSLVMWAWNHLTDREWTLMAGHFVGLLVKYREYELLYSIQDKKNINASPPHTRDALNKIVENTFLDGKDSSSHIIWLVEHGHASLHLGELIYWVGRDWNGAFTPSAVDLIRLLSSPTGSSSQNKLDERPSYSSKSAMRPKWEALKIPVFNFCYPEISDFADPSLPPTSAEIFELFCRFQCLRCGQLSSLEFLDCLIQVFGMNPNEISEDEGGLSDLLIEIILSSAETPEIDNWIIEAASMFIEHKVRFVFNETNSCSIAHASAQRKLLPLIHLLIDYGVDFKEVNGNGQTAFDLMPSELRAAITQT